MNAAVIAWMRGATFTRWWALPDHQLRIAMVLVAMAELRDGVAVVESTGDRLAAACRTSRGSLLRAVDALVAAGFCVISAKGGRRGTSIITITGCDQKETSPPTGVSQEDRRMPISSLRSVKTPQTDQLEVTETVHESLADLGDRDQFMDAKPISLGQIASDPRARDQDLQRSDPDPSLGSDPRSSASRDQSNKMVGNSPDPKPAEKRRRIDAAKIPERAWAAADYLRSRILIKNPAALVGNKPWEDGYKWTAGAGDRIGDGSRTGLRLSWADEFRLFYQRLHTAMRNANKAISEEDVWTEIARTVHWLFHNQQTGPQFIIESPGSIATKWDRIQEIRKRPPDAPRGANGRPDPIAKRDWIPADQWGKK